MKPTIQTLLAGIVKSLFMIDAEIEVTIPENVSNGDYTSNIAMILAGRLKAPPLKIGQEIIDAIKKHQIESGLPWLDRIEIVKPGFINLWLSTGYFGSQLTGVLERKEQYGSRLNEVKSPKSKVKSPEKSGSKKQPVLTAKTKSPQFPQSPQFPLSSSSSAGKDEKKETLASFGNPKTIMVEFAHPNTHKAFHIGHLRNITTGESIIRLLESQGNKVIRVNYQGDVGMHIAKALYALLHLEPYKDDISALHIGSVKLPDNDLVHKRVEFLGKAYAAGSMAFEGDEAAKATIVDLNALIYASAQQYAREVGRDPGTTDYLKLVKNQVHPLEKVYELWKETRQWSLDYFEMIYKRAGSTYDRLYFESECLAGVDMAKDAVKQGVLKESDGAIIFEGKPHSIDTRVFVNSLGLPTYEGKELALSRMQTTEFGHLDRIIHVVGPEQASFFAVAFKAEELLGFVDPGVQYHLIYGWVKLKSGKMSSRTGQVVLGEWLLDEAKKSIYEILDASASPLKDDPLKDDVAEKAAIAAVKYAFLRVGTNQEIAFDLKESISFDGDSGPYLLYSYARARSVLRKASSDSVLVPSYLSHLGTLSDLNLNPEERAVARRISQFPEVVEDAATRFAPNTLCTYLFHLAQEFNVFYAKHAILKSDKQEVRSDKEIAKDKTSHLSLVTYRSQFRLALTAATAQVLKNGLYLLGIQTVERM